MRLILFLLLSTSLFAAPVTVLDTVFDKLDLDSLNDTIEKYRLKAPVSPDEKNEELLNYFFRAERAYFERQPHDYQFYLTKAEKLCELNSLEEVSTRLSLSCALTYSELSQNKTAFSKLIYLQKAKGFLAKAKKQAEQAELYYVEGRLQMSDADPIAPRLGKSILNFQMLLRSRPDLTQTTYWITKAYQLSGNTSAFSENLEAALKTNNLRTHLKFGQTKTILRQFNEGIDFGSQFGLYASQLNGFGALYRIWDDKIFDRMRGAEILLNASTRKNFGAGIEYSDSELFPDYALGLKTAFSYQFEEYYGLGLASAFSDRSIFRFQTWDSALEFTRELVSNFNLTVGWAFHQRHINELTEGLFANYPSLSGEDIFFSGGYFQGEWNILEAEDYSLSGGRMRLKGYFPTKELLSNVSFQKWTADLEIHTSLWGILGKAMAATSQVSDEVPFDALSEVSRDLRVPGVRASRYRDKHLTAMALELKRKVFGPFVLGAYSTGVLEQFNFKTTKGGFGGLIEVYLSSFKTRQARIEVGSFNGEFVFGLDLGLGL